MSPFQWFRNISIKKKLYFGVGIMALLIAMELLTLWFSIHTLSAVRAYVEGEGLWSKSQKDAIHYLRKYAHSRDEADYKSYLKFMQVPKGDHKARLELMKTNPDLDIARQGFLEGRNNPGDVDGMITLFRRFHNISYINNAIVAWVKADEIISQLPSIADDLHREINAKLPDTGKIEALNNKAGDINAQITGPEDDFSYSLGEGSRWLENVVLRLLFAVALTVEISGLIITISVSRSIQKGLSEILQASRKIAKGDLSARAKAHSKDEIGVLANSFNQMAEELEHGTESMKEYAQKLEQSNNSLEQFAYVASHDLQEPLRTITNYVGLLEQKLEGNQDEETTHFMKRVVNAANRMKTMVNDVLDYSRIGKYREIEMVNYTKVVNDVLLDMNSIVKESQARIIVNELPEIKSSRSEIHQLFQNLISNSIKYRKPDIQPLIEITAELIDRNWTFTIKDNGIGIDPEYQNKIFVIFKRLHNHNEYSGTGIGLATCKKIVELNGGDIWVESAEGNGSTFYFTIPNI